MEGLTPAPSGSLLSPSPTTWEEGGGRVHSRATTGSDPIQNDQTIKHTFYEHFGGLSAFPPFLLLLPPKEQPRPLDEFQQRISLTFWVSCFERHQVRGTLCFAPFPTDPGVRGQGQGRNV